MQNSNNLQYVTDKWRSIPYFLDGYLDVMTILTLSMISKELYNYRWKFVPPNSKELNSNVILNFCSYQGYDGSLILNALKILLHKLNDEVFNNGIIIDFSHCCLILDSHLRTLFNSKSILLSSISTGCETKEIKIVGLIFDYLFNLTDETMNTILSTNLPYLEFISCQYIKNEKFTGDYLTDAFSPQLWPSIKNLSFNFSSITYSNICKFLQKHSTTIYNYTSINDDNLNGYSTKSTQKINISSCNKSPEILDSNDSKFVDASYSPTNISILSLLSANNAKSIHKTVKERLIINNNCNNSNNQITENIKLNDRSLHSETYKSIKTSFNQNLEMNIPTIQTYESVRSSLSENTFNSNNANKSDSVMKTTYIFNDSSDVKISFIGTPASRYFFELPFLKIVCNQFESAINSNDYYLVEEICLHKHNTAVESDNILTHYIFNNVIKNNLKLYLANLPIKQLNVDESLPVVWTYPLVIATQNNLVDLFEVLLFCGAEINLADFLNKGLLNYSVLNDNTNITKIIIKNNMLLHAINIEIPLPICTAIEKNDIKHVKLLLESGYNINIKAPSVKSFHSPLITACKTSNEYAINLLLEWGANINEFSKSSKNNPIMLVYKTNLKLFYLLIRSNKFKSITLASEVLASAIAKDDIDTVKIIVNTFPNIFKKNHPIWSLPHIQAARTGSMQILSFIITKIIYNLDVIEEFKPRLNILCLEHKMAKESNLSNKSEIGKLTSHNIITNITSDITSLSSNASDNHNYNSYTYTITSMSATHNKYVNDNNDAFLAPSNSELLTIAKFNEVLNFRATENKNTALHYASEQGHIKCVKILLKYGCEVNIKNINGDTPLHLACAEDNYIIVAYLLSCGSDPFNMLNEKKENAFMISIKMRNDKSSYTILDYYKNSSRTAELGTVIEQIYTGAPNNISLFEYAIQSHRFNIAIAMLQFIPINKIPTLDESKCDIITIKLIEMTKSLTDNEAHKEVTNKIILYLQKEIDEQELNNSILNNVSTTEQYNIINWNSVCLLCDIEYNNLDTNIKKLSAMSGRKKSKIKSLHHKVITAAKKSLTIFSNKQNTKSYNKQL